MGETTALQTLMTSLSTNLSADTLYTAFSNVLPYIGGIAVAVLVYGLIRKGVKTFVNRRKFNM